MKELGYGRGYRYDPAEADGVADQEYLPDALRGEVFYRPGRYGAESAIAERLAWWAERRAAARGQSPGGGGPGDAESGAAGDAERVVGAADQGADAEAQPKDGGAGTDPAGTAGSRPGGS
jgi:hypothetical protein